jgi:putative PIN family toxin of toxin-antitoxin system
VRIVLDTNVLVAGLLNPAGACGRLLDLVLDEMVSLAVDERILQEYEEVLLRPEFALPAAIVRQLLSFLRRSGEPVAALPLSIGLPDPDDLPFLEVAAAAGAVLITGNQRHYPKRAAGRVAVVSPAECLNLLSRPA